MKNGKAPTRRQAEEIRAAGLDPEKWLISKSEPHRMELVHRETGAVRVMERAGRS